MKTIEDFNFKNKKALIRVDFNVPLNNNFEVTDATRIEAAKPTIKKILEDGGSVVLMSHLGRPKGVEAAYSLKHIVEKVTECSKNKENKHIVANVIKDYCKRLIKNLN